MVAGTVAGFHRNNLKCPRCASLFRKAVVVTIGLQKGVHQTAKVGDDRFQSRIRKVRVVNRRSWRALLGVSEKSGMTNDGTNDERNPNDDKLELRD